MPLSTGTSSGTNPDISPGADPGPGSGPDPAVAPGAPAGRRIILGGTPVDLMVADELLAVVRERLAAGASGGAGAGDVAPLAIGSANLDHIHHFGPGGASRDDLDAAGASPAWLVLLDGAPLVRRAAALTGTRWPLLAGSDMLPGLLAVAEETGAGTGFLGGTSEMHDRLRSVLSGRFPGLRITGTWAPERREFADPQAAAGIADAVRASGTDLLVVGLGKPRQERWIQRYAERSGARVLLAFGASADFLAGTATRAPAGFRRYGLEWLYRLLREPRRLARRYCLQGPPALWRLRTASQVPAPAATPVPER